MSNDDVDDNNINNQLSNVEVMNASDDDDDRIDDVISSKGEDCYKLWKITRHW